MLNSEHLNQLWEAVKTNRFQAKLVMSVPVRDMEDILAELSEHRRVKRQREEAEGGE